MDGEHEGRDREQADDGPTSIRPVRSWSIHPDNRLNWWTAVWMSTSLPEARRCLSGEPVVRSWLDQKQACSVVMPGV